MEVCFVGYLRKEIVWKGGGVCMVVEDERKGLEEVVVVGYGSEKKVKLRGCVGMGESDVLENRGIGKLGEGLEGVIGKLKIWFGNGNGNGERSVNVGGVR